MTLLWSQNSKMKVIFFAHLGQKLVGELSVYQRLWLPASICLSVPQRTSYEIQLLFHMSSFPQHDTIISETTGLIYLNFMWSLLLSQEQNFDQMVLRSSNHPHLIYDKLALKIFLITLDIGILHWRLFYMDKSRS